LSFIFVSNDNLKKIEQSNWPKTYFKSVQEQH